MFRPLAPDAAAAVRGAVLCVPSVSVGNVGQLCVDLLLETLPDARRVGFLHHESVLPAVGAAGGPASSSSSAAAAVLPVEVWSVPSLRLAVVQRRAPCAPGRRAAFAADLAAWARDAGVARAVLLCSAPAHRRGDRELAPAEPVALEKAPGPIGRAMEAAGVPAAAVLAFASDGDNAPDAFRLAPAALRSLAPECPQPPEWRAPAAWDGVFGAPADLDIYC